MAQMPQVGRDPFQYADDYNRNMTALGAQNEDNAQNALIRMFATEAARQQPWSDLPVDMAKQNNASANSFRNSLALYGAKQSMKPAMAPTKIANIVRQTAKTYGLDSDIMLTLADIESSFNPNAKNASGASGLFQFMPNTAQQYGLANPFDPVQNADAAARLMRDNAQYLQKNGVPITAGTIYLAHQQGLDGAVKLLKNPDAPAEGVIGRKAVIQNGGRPGMSSRAFAQMWMNKADRLYKMRQEQRGKGANDVGTRLADLESAMNGGTTMAAPDGGDDVEIID